MSKVSDLAAKAEKLVDSAANSDERTAEVLLAAARAYVDIASVLTNADES